VIETVKQAKWRSVTFLLFSLATIALFFIPLLSLYRFSVNDETFSYIPLIPVVSGFLIFQRRKEIFSRVTGSLFPGAVLVSIGIVLYVFGSLNGFAWNPVDRHSLMALSAVSCFAGGIGICFGSGTLIAALFPLVFLLFMAPFPPFLMDPIINFLQYCSAEVSYVFFKLTGVPVYRDGYLFHLPGIYIEVAKQCSGIRSSLSLFLVSLLAGHLMLRENWRKGVLVLSVIPIAIVKNAVRIVTLSLLAVYVDPRILGTVAHRRGGIPIFLLALVLLGCVLWLLRRGESKETPP
jgi:exosortase